MAKEPSDLIYPYMKLRRDFGRQPQFIEDHGRTHVNIAPNKNLKKKTRRMKFVDKQLQAGAVQAESEMNTIRAEFANTGMNHLEGGWPKDIDLSEPEMLARYRKKLEKDEGYQASMMEMTKLMEKLIKQNTALDIYGELFEETCDDTDVHRQPPVANVVEVFRDPTSSRRPVSKIAWAPDSMGKFGVCHCPLEFDTGMRDVSPEAFLWDASNSSRPEALIRAGTSIVDMKFNPKDLHKIVGGCFDGSVCIWDNRSGPNPVEQSQFGSSHNDICTGVIWVNSKTGSEFFSAGLDGQVIWWDDRKLSEMLENTWLDPEKGQCRPEAAVGASILEFESTLPTKFMAGTVEGQVMIMMRKGKNPNEKLVHLYKAHQGAVKGLQRNPTFIKNFLTVGDNTCRMFAEDCKESSVLWTKPGDSQYTHGAWIPTRASSFVCSCTDGNLHFWDMLVDPVKPHLTIRVCDDCLTTVSPSDSGRFVAVGTDQGYVSMIKLSDSLCVSDKSDKPALASIFERESRREKFLEQRNRELRLRKRDKDKAETEKVRLEEEKQERLAKAMEHEKTTGQKLPLPDLSDGKKYDIVYETQTDPIVLAEKEFFQTIRTEMEIAGVNAFPDVVVPDESEERRGSDSSQLLSMSNIDLAALNLDLDENKEEGQRGKEHSNPDVQRPSVASDSTVRNSGQSEPREETAEQETGQIQDENKRNESNASAEAESTEPQQSEQPESEEPEDLEAAELEQSEPIEPVEPESAQPAEPEEPEQTTEPTNRGDNDELDEMNEYEQEE